MNNSVEQNPFHLAIPVHNLIIAREFYSKTLGFVEGRSDEKWIDFNFYGHQLVIHDTGEKTTSNNNFVDGHGVPVPHFGVVLTMNKWQSFKKRLISKKINFIIEPYVRFQNLPGEQATMFFLDPSGNALEFKAFKNLDNLFKK
ncbi:MAG: VOC family protein [Flavobacteriales bacterium]|nr:VOC family protein [Flavobacteriales bacterium]